MDEAASSFLLSLDQYLSARERHEHDRDEWSAENLKVHEEMFKDNLKALLELRS